MTERRGEGRVENEEAIVSIIANSGEARSTSMHALEVAREGRCDEAEQLLDQAQKSVLEAHKSQMDMISREAGGEHQEVSLLMVHAQDHVMTTMAVMEMVGEFINVYRELGELKGRGGQK